jgi:hypothetical protein
VVYIQLFYDLKINEVKERTKLGYNIVYLVGSQLFKRGRAGEKTLGKRTNVNRL